MSIDYVVMLVYCLVILIILLAKAIFDFNLTSYQKILLLIALISEFVMLFSEIIGSLNTLDYLNFPISLCYLNSFIFFIGQSSTNYITFLLLALITGYISLNDKKKRYLFTIPALFTILIAFISMFTGWLFYIDDNGAYAQGPINFLQYITVAFYLSYIGFYSLIKVFIKKYQAQRNLNISIVFYALLPLVGVILQFSLEKILSKTYPLILAFITVSTLIIYLQLLQNQVQIDTLTNIPNRNKFMRYLKNKMKRETDELYLFILDINNFKSINDKYGHLEGDRVLEIISKNLTIFSEETGFFVARYAGDEFCIVGNLNEITISDLKPMFVKYLDLINKEINDDRYTVSIAIGYTKFDESKNNIKDFINVADEEMYKDKEKYHKLEN